MCCSNKGKILYNFASKKIIKSESSYLSFYCRLTHVYSLSLTAVTRIILRECSYFQQYKEPPRNGDLV